MNLTRDLLDHIATAREDGSDFARLVLADRLEECGEHDRAEVMRLGVELGRRVECRHCRRHTVAGRAFNMNAGEQMCRVCEALRTRVHELTTRNPAWLSVPCPRAEASGYAARDVCGTGCTCNGTGDLLRDRATITRGFVTVTLPSALCWQRRCEVCGTSRWGRGDGCIYCDGACGPKVKDHPHPVLAAILASPVGIWVEAVRVSDKKPFHYLDAPKWGWSRWRPTYRDDPSNALPPNIYDLIPLGNVYDTADAANDAVSRVVPRWARARLEDAR